MRARWRMAVLIGVVLAVTAAGCGGTTGRAAPTPKPSPTTSSADKACRARWTALAATAQTAAGKGVSLRRAFASRWASISAGIDYYAKTARADQCTTLLDGRKAAIRDTSALLAKALPYDAGRRLALATARRTADRALPGGQKEPKAVRTAYQTLSKQTPSAAEDLAPAYAELAAAEASDQKAVKQAMSDIALLSETSDGYRKADRALAVIKAWHRELVAKAKKKTAKKKKEK